jgi:hypothetical protein
MRLSKFGIAVAAVYMLWGAYLIATQGLFGESFISIVLGLPWSYLLLYVGATDMIGDNLILIYLWIFAPIALNIAIVYALGYGFEKLFSKIKLR